MAIPPAFIAQYEYKGQTVYYLPPRCCDVASTVFDPSGTIRDITIVDAGGHPSVAASY